MKKLLLAIVSILAVGCSPKMPKIDGVDFSITKDVYENSPGRQEVKVQVNKEISEEEVKTISEWVKQKHSDVKTFIIFFYLPGQSNAWARVDYEPYKFELLSR